MGALVHDGLLVCDRPTATNLKVVIRFAVLQRLSPAVKPGMYDKVYWWGYLLSQDEMASWNPHVRRDGVCATDRNLPCSKRMTRI